VFFQKQILFFIFFIFFMRLGFRSDAGSASTGGTASRMTHWSVIVLYLTAVAG
jgi:hypothetical protein